MIDQSFLTNFRNIFRRIGIYHMPLFSVFIGF